MLRALRIRLKEYVKEPITVDNLAFPWNFNGVQPNDEGNMTSFFQWQRILNEEKMDTMVQQLWRKINEKAILRLEPIVEHSLMSKMHREIQRLNHHKYNLTFDLKCQDFQLYQIENIYRVGVHKGRNRNRILDIAQFQMQIEGVPYTCVFKKRPQFEDMATLSMCMDISFKTSGSVRLLDQDNKVVLESNDDQLHTIRLESDVMTCNYKSSKSAEMALKDMRRMEDNLHIVDIDGTLNGNSYTGSS